MSGSTVREFELALERVSRLGALVVRDAAETSRESKKISDQLDDALDALSEAQEKIRIRDEMIAELQQMVSSRRTGR